MPYGVDAPVQGRTVAMKGRGQTTGRLLPAGVLTARRECAEGQGGKVSEARTVLSSESAVFSPCGPPMPLSQGEPQGAADKPKARGATAAQRASRPKAASRECRAGRLSPRPEKRFRRESRRSARIYQLRWENEGV